MSGADWLSYSLQDFIMFGPQVFLRLFARINVELWPWSLLAVVAGLAVPVLWWNHRLLLKRLALGLVSLAWITSGYVFLVGYFGPINLPAEWFGWAFVVQGVFLALIALFGAAAALQSRNGVPAVVWLAAVIGLPWLTVAETGDWQAVALWGVAPGITAAASSLAIGFVPGLWRWVYMLLPLAWSLFSAATFWVLQTWWLMVLPVATLLFIGLGFRFSPRRVRN